MVSAHATCVIGTARTENDDDAAATCLVCSARCAAIARGVGCSNTSVGGSATPLMEAGIDSLAATELSNQLRDATGLTLSPTLVFEQPTPRAIAAQVLEEVCQG